MGGDDPHFDMQDYLINWNAGPFGLVLRPELGSDMPPCVAQVLPEQSVAKLSGVRAGDMLISINGKKTSKLGYEKVVKMLYKERLPVILHFRTPQGSSGRGVGSSNADVSSTHDNINGTFITELQPSSRGRAVSSTPSMQRVQQNHHQQQQHPHPIQRPPPDFDSRSTTSTATRAVPRGDLAQRERKQYTAVWENGSLGISFRPYSPRVNVPCVDFIGTRGVGRGMDRVCVNDVLIAINGEKTKALGVERVLRWLLVIEKPVVLRFHSSSNRVAHGQSNSIESYQPEYEPARGTTTTAQKNETPRLQILYDPPPPPPSPSLAPQQQKQQQQNDARRSQPMDARRLNNPSLNSYLASAHHQSGRLDLKERRYTNNALPRENQIALDINTRVQKPQPNSRGGPYRTEYVDLSVDTKPEMRRHQSTNLPSEYEQARNGDRPRRYSNDSINLNQQGTVAPQTPPTRREERREPVVSYLSNDRILYEPEAPAPRDPELERPRQRRYSNANSIMSNAKAYGGGAGGKTADSPDRYTRGQSPAAGHYVPQQVPVRGAPSKSEELSLDEAIRIVVKSSGKPITEFVFGGVPILTIREGSPQAKLLFTYAKACLAKEKQAASPVATDVQRMRSNTTSSVVSSVTTTTDMRDAAALAGDFTRDLPPQQHYQQQQQQQRLTAGNTLGRHGSSNFLSYKFAEESAERTRTLSDEASVLPPFRAPAQNYSPQVVAVVPPPPPAIKPSAASPLPPQTKQPMPMTSSDREAPLPSDDFISLKDFVVQGDGQIADRNTVSSMNSASTHVHSVDSEDDLLTVGSQLVAPPVRQQSDNEAVASDSNQNQQEALAFDRRALNNTDISISFKTDEDKHASSSDMITLSDLATNDMAVTAKSEPQPETKKPVDPVVQREIDDVTHVEKSSLMHPLIAEMYGFLPDLHNIVKDKSVDTLLKKKGVLDEIQEILQSLQMEAQFERHSTLGIGTLPSLPPQTLDSTTLAPQPSTRGKQCFQCGKTGELADLALEGGRRELYCQDCWEVFFFSEDHRLQEEETESVATSATPRSTGRDSTDDAYKYSFHDSSVSRSDMMIGPWRYLNGDGTSSIRDSTTTIGSSITDRADEVWL